MLYAVAGMRAAALMLVLALAAAPAQRPPNKPAQPTQPRRNLVFWKMSRASVDMLLSGIPQGDSLRLAQLRQTFHDLQCRGPQLHEQPAPGGNNLICTLPGDKANKDGAFLFLADYTHQGTGQGAVENWSGALMLPFLYHALSAAPRAHTFLFAEVQGESGARALFDSFTPAQRKGIQGVVAFEALGLGPAQFYIEPDDTYAYYAWTRLQRPLRQAAADQQTPEPGYAIPGSWRKADATREFRHHNTPVMLIHSVDSASRQVPGSVRDTATAIDHDVYFKTLTLLADYAVELDRVPPPTRAR